MAWKLKFSSRANKDAEKIENSPYKKKVYNFLDLLEEDPLKNPPPYEKLTSEEHTYSRRINIKHRLVYRIFKEEKIVKIIRMWTHYE